VEHGPGVTLAVLSRAVGLSPPALLKRFGSKERLLFRALLPRRPPRWAHTLAQPPGPDPKAELARVLVELCEGFEQVGPAFAALRMSAVDVSEVFPRDQPGPSVLVRRQLTDWLERAGATGDVGCRADAAVGAAEARGFLRWVSPQLVDPSTDAAWAEALAALCLGG